MKPGDLYAIYEHCSNRVHIAYTKTSYMQASIDVIIPQRLETFSEPIYLESK